MELAAIVSVIAVERAPKELLWQSVWGVAGVSRREFDGYFAGIDDGTAIWLADVTPLQSRIPLAELRMILPGFQPPQGYRYLNHNEVARLGLRKQRRVA